MKRFALLFIILILIFCSAQLRAEKNGTNDRSFSSSSQNMQKQFDKTFAYDWGSSGLALKAPPDMGGDIEGGGDSGIGRDVLPVGDSVWIIPGLSFIYLFFTIFKQKRKFLRLK